MIKTTRRYRAAASLIFVLAALHVVVASFAFPDYGWRMIVVAGIWTLLGLGLMRGWRWCAYLAFLGAIFGISVSLGSALVAVGLVAILFWLIVLTNLIAAVVLFGLLWSNRATARKA